jgi:hypothetical protein
MLEIENLLNAPTAPIHVRFRPPAREGTASWGDGMPEVDFAFNVNREVTGLTIHDPKLTLRIVAGRDSFEGEPWLRAIAEAIEEYFSIEMY